MYDVEVILKENKRRYAYIVKMQYDVRIGAEYITIEAANDTTIIYTRENVLRVHISKRPRRLW